MRPLFASGILVAAITSLSPDPSPPLALHIAGGAWPTTATCTLIHRQADPGGTVLYFATAGHLFRSAEGSRLPGSATIVDRGRAIEVPREGVILPPAAIVDLAVLRVIVRESDLVPTPLAAGAPGPGDDFHILGFDGGETSAGANQRVRIRTSALLLGDRDASGLRGCEGAPAISAQGMFGVVVGCEPGQIVIVSLLELADSFLRRHVPGLGIGLQSIGVARGVQPPVGGPDKV
jgi:hypothetical protein